MKLKVEYVPIEDLKPYENYADVIIQRWENFTGKKAIKIN